MVEKTQVGKPTTYQIMTDVVLPAGSKKSAKAQISAIRDLCKQAESDIKLETGDAHDVLKIWIRNEDAQELWISLLDDALFDLGLVALESARVNYDLDDTVGHFFIGPSEAERKAHELNVAFAMAISTLKSSGDSYRGAQGAITEEQALPAMRGLFAGKTMTLVLGYFPDVPETPVTYLLDGTADQAKARMKSYLDAVSKDPEAIEPMMPHKGTFKALFYLDQSAICRHLTVIDPIEGSLHALIDGDPDE